MFGRRRTYALVLFFIAMTFHTAFAQPNATGPTTGPTTGPQKSGDATQAKADYQLEETVTSATRAAVAVDEAPAKVTVITPEQMKRKNVATVQDALKSEMSLQIKKIKTSDSTAAVTMRGVADQKRTLIMVDGQAVNDGYSGGVSWGSIPVDDIERIEIVRGPASAVYGGQAMGGLVNIITKMPDKFTASARGGIGVTESVLPKKNGEVGWTERWGGSAGHKVGDLRIRVSVEGEHAEMPATNLVVRDTTNLYPTRTSTTTSTGTGANRVQTTTTNVTDLGVRTTTTDVTRGTGAAARTTSSATQTPVGNAGGWFTTNLAGSPAVVVGDKGDDIGNRLLLSGSLSYDLTETGRIRFDSRVSTNGYDYGAPHTYLKSMADSGKVWNAATVEGRHGLFGGTLNQGTFQGGRGSTVDQVYTGMFDQKFGEVGLKLSGSYSDQKNTYSTVTTTSPLGYEDAPGQLTETWRNIWQGDLQTTIPLPGDHKLVTGGSARIDNYYQIEHALARWRNWSTQTRPATQGEGRTANYAVFLEDEWKALDWLTLHAGLRLDHHIHFDGRAGDYQQQISYQPNQFTELSPRAGLVLHPLEDSYLRASVSKGFRAPGLYELLRTWRSNTGTLYIGNSDLLPESLWTYETGFDQYFWDRRVKVGASFFHTDFDNYIASVDSEPGVRQARNIGRSRIDGIEASGEIRPFDWIKLFGNIAYYDTEVLEYSWDRNLRGKKLTDVAPFQAKWGSEVTYGPVEWGFYGRYQDQRFGRDDNTDENNVYGSYSSRTVWDSKISYTPCDFMKVSFSVDNIFNALYWDYYASQGRSYYMELALKW